MHESFLKDIAIVLGVAAVISAITRKYKLPTVLGYMIAGLIIGPYIPIPLFADPARVEGLSEFGVILVMFAVGLEFRLSRFFQVLPTAGITAIIEISMMGLLGLSIGHMLNWGTAQSIFLGGALAISSTMIVSKVFEEHRPSLEVREHVFGILIIQDIIAILLLTVLGTFAASRQIELNEIIPTTAKLLSVLIFSTIAGLFVIPRFIRYIAKQRSAEVLTIVSIGVCFAAALIVKSMGYSVALGAFLAGILVSESGEGHRIERLTRPLKDVFAAIFFVSVGMSVNPILAYKHLPESLLITFAIVLFQGFTVFFGSILSGAGTQKSLYSSLALGQIGEFAFIIAAIGANADITTKSFQAIIVTVAVLSSLCTPVLWKKSDSIVNYLSKRMPNSLRIAIGLYEAWFHQLQEVNLSGKTKFLGIPKKILIPMAIDIILLIVLPPSILKFLPDFLLSFKNATLSEFKGEISLVVVCLAIFPIFYGFIKSSSQLVNFLTRLVFSEIHSDILDKGAARKLFSLTLWCLIFFIVGLPMLSALSPFTNSLVFFLILVFLVLTAFWRLWKGAQEVAENFESGGERLVTVLKRQTYGSNTKTKAKAKLEIPSLENVDQVTVLNKELVGKSLSEVNLRNVTGVTVISIHRNNERIFFPNHGEVLLKGDVLYVWGSDEAKEKCKDILGK